MHFSAKINTLDFTGAVTGLTATMGFAWFELVNNGSEERRQETSVRNPPLSIAIDTPPTDFGEIWSPPPNPTWSFACWVQETARLPEGYLFRSGYMTELPAAIAPAPDPFLEIIIAGEEQIDAARLAEALPALPLAIDDMTTITAIAPLTISGTSIALNVTGTDARLPPGDTFTFTALLGLSPNVILRETDQPLALNLVAPSLTFNAAPGTGLSTAILNVVSGAVLAGILPKIRDRLTFVINDGVLSTVAAQLNKGVPTPLPPSVVLTVRFLRATTKQMPDGSTEPAIGVLAALGGFGGVGDKFPGLVLSGGGGTGKPCFLATAALEPDAPALSDLRAFREKVLRKSRAGRAFIATYEALSPPLAQFIAKRPWRRALARMLVVRPTHAIARRSLRRRDLL